MNSFIQDYFNGQCKKENDLSLGSSLESQNIAGAENLQRDMPVNVDTCADTKSQQNKNTKLSFKTTLFIKTGVTGSVEICNFFKQQGELK